LPAGCSQTRSPRHRVGGRLKSRSWAHTRRLEQTWSAGTIIIAGTPDQPGLALLADRPMISDQPTAYVCRNFVCKLPVTSVDDLAAQLRAL
jgi:uncharacterized protein YyaL (SSP411 family)